MRTLRNEVNTVLQSLPCIRKPFLRRSLRSDMLLCTDLPQAADEQTVSLAVERLADCGWRVEQERGLLQLDKLPKVPISIGTEPTGEHACLIALLRRHPNDEAAPELVRAWLKAVESHREDELMHSWHREWAVKLRCKQPLPGGLLPWLLAYEKETGI